MTNLILSATRRDLPAPVRAVVLYSLFLGAAWAAMRLISGSPLGVVLGPLVAQGAMAGVILATRSAGRPDADRTAASTGCRRLRLFPLVVIALGGFLFQVAILAGGSMLSSVGSAGAAASRAVAGSGPAWGVLLFTSVVGAPLIEEVFFRGMLQPLLSRRHVVLGLLATAALFGAAHGFGMPFRAVPTFLQGIVLGALVLLTGRLRAAVAVHAMNNALVLAATVLVALRPQGVGAAPGSVGVTAAVLCALLALMLLGWGFHGIRREPRLPAPLTPALPRR